MAVILPTEYRDLNDRERAILRAIVQLFVLHAIPVGSSVVSKYLEIVEAKQGKTSECGFGFGRGSRMNLALGN